MVVPLVGEYDFENRPRGGLFYGKQTAFNQRSAHKGTVLRMPVSSVSASACYFAASDPLESTTAIG